MTRTIVVSFRGEKLEFPLTEESEMFVFDLKQKIATQVSSKKKSDGTDQSSSNNNNGMLLMEPNEVKLIFKGKVLDNDRDLWKVFVVDGKQSSKKIKIMATGVSQMESQKMEDEFKNGIQKTSRLVRDDISDIGKKQMKKRQILGQQMITKANTKTGASNLLSSSKTNNYGFGRIESLPNLPDEAKARRILTELANDPGIRACMAKHKWNVGSLAELYPEGKVGQSEVCVMGLNRNKGQQILLRVRTDDLNGFRKILSIREVLYHELAHNVHSEHNVEFFQLMRQIKRECLEMDWTNGNVLSTDIDDTNTTKDIVVGTYILGGDVASQEQSGLSAREMAGRAAILRLTAEEEKIRESCGCGRLETLFQIREEEPRKGEDDT